MTTADCVAIVTDILPFFLTSAQLILVLSEWLHKINQPEEEKGCCEQNNQCCGGFLWYKDDKGSTLFFTGRLLDL